MPGVNGIIRITDDETYCALMDSFVCSIIALERAGNETWPTTEVKQQAYDAALVAMEGYLDEKHDGRVRLAHTLGGRNH